MRFDLLVTGQCVCVCCRWQIVMSVVLVRRLQARLSPLQTRARSQKLSEKMYGGIRVLAVGWICHMTLRPPAARR